MKTEKQLLEEAASILACMYQLSENRLSNDIKVKTYDVWFDTVNRFKKDYEEFLSEPKPI